MRRSRQGMVAAGHEGTAAAAAQILAAGGNAFDAALAALCASCICEPVLASLGGGGFLMAGADGHSPLLYDFFVQTPRHKPAPADMDFYPITADFGTAQQEFHIGMGSIATPGVIKGLFRIHQDLCTMPLEEIIQPACALAREGVEINPLQYYISTVVAPILESTPEARALHCTDSGRLAGPGDRLCQHEMANTLELLAKEGEQLFYKGELGQLLITHSTERGGCLQQQDLEHYAVIRRQPLQLEYHDARLFTNPAPSLGGTLIALALALLQPDRLGRHKAGGPEHLVTIARVQQLIQRLRREQGIDRDLCEDSAARLLAAEQLRSYRDILDKHPRFPRGTTQISVADSRGNLASMTLSNGEGAGYVIPGSGIMLNNMLGEEDINPHGFHQWPENRRIASMMAPTLAVVADGRTIVTGSGGSNRIRSAIQQVLTNLIDLAMPVEQAVEMPRLHYESGVLNMESGIGESAISRLEHHFPQHRIWPQRNLFFGGAHTLVRHADGTIEGVGDSRRGGVAL